MHSYYVFRTLIAQLQAKLVCVASALYDDPLHPRSRADEGRVTRGLEIRLARER